MSRDVQRGRRTAIASFTVLQGAQHPTVGQVSEWPWLRDTRQTGKSTKRAVSKLMKPSRELALDKSRSNPDSVHWLIIDHRSAARCPSFCFHASDADMDARRGCVVLMRDKAESPLADGTQSTREGKVNRLILEAHFGGN